MSLVLIFCRATNTVVQSSVLLALTLWNSRYNDQEQRVTSLTFLGLLIRCSSDYQNDSITGMTIPTDYSYDCSLITSSLVFLGTFSNWCDVTDIMFACLWEFGIFWSYGLVSYESIVCSWFVSQICRILRMFYWNLLRN